VRTVQLEKHSDGTHEEKGGRTLEKHPEEKNNIK
jgi:hypothetical protein